MAENCTMQDEKKRLLELVDALNHWPQRPSVAPLIYIACCSHCGWSYPLLSQDFNRAGENGHMLFCGRDECRNARRMMHNSRRREGRKGAR